MQKCSINRNSMFIVCLDLPSGYRLEYTVLDKERVVFVLFIGNHDDAAAYLRGKK